jgi:CotH protein/chitobiase/beta-hexosaminidase-like protein
MRVDSPAQAQTLQRAEEHHLRSCSSMQNHLHAIRLWVGLGALVTLALLTALFASSPLREPIGWQLANLSYLRGRALRPMMDTPPETSSGHLREQQAAIRADYASGFYDRPLMVTLTQSKPGAIYYRLDDGKSSGKPLRYLEPIPIDRTTVLSFASLSSELATRRVESRTYLLNEADDLPVLSLSLNPSFLWNRYAGIYRNPYERGRAWQRPAQVEYFEARNSPPTRVPAEVKIHGNWSRSAEKKSFQLTYAAARVSGADRQRMLVWPGDQAPNRTLVLRAAAVDASYRLGDELFRSVYADAGGLITRGAALQLLLNGARWGLYNLYEKIDKALLQRIRGAGDYDLIHNPAYGNTPDADAWNSMLEFFIHTDLAKDSNFEQAAKLIDVENFTDYWLFNIYAANVDWPHNNYYAFRKRAADERWRWIAWDSDATFNGNTGLAHETLTWATRDELRHDLSYGGKEYDDERWLVSTAIIRSLLRNRNYQARFVRRFCEIHHSYFKPTLLQARFQGIVNQITPRLAADWERWPGSKQAYLEGMQGVRRFIAERPAIVLEQFQKRFGFSDCPAS